MNNGRILRTVSQQRDPSANVASSTDTSSNAFLAQTVADERATLGRFAYLTERTHTWKVTMYHKQHNSRIIIASKKSSHKKVWYQMLVRRVRSPSPRTRLLLCRRVFPTHIAHNIRILLVRISREPLLTPRRRW